ncbi:MAG TPA: 50S ribosomal protein L15 [Planctomycetaceae bacterium]|nr:50S ribosomal protein L15 [Planctomycetaceae bacterium]HRF00383.1 50S ribosomal protein L15 [Pirellulaceae bacterium]
MKLHDIHQDVETHRARKRLGRGPGSGTGKTAGQGHKGSQSRAGNSQQVTFQGGMMPVVRRVPKRGFNNRFALDVIAVNVGDLELWFESGAEICPKVLKEKGLVKRRHDVFKVLGDGDLTKKFKIHAHRFSASAKEKIEAVGGECVILPGKAPVVKNPQKSARKK